MKIKICGMKFRDNISEIAALQPDYLGFIFYDKSPRYFNNDLPIIAKSIQKVGVFVNASFDEIEEMVIVHQLDLVQLHGYETAEFCALIESKLVKVIKAFAVDNSFIFSCLGNYFYSCSYFLFDTKGAKYGGNGNAFTWNILKNYRLKKPYFLSGGIGMDNMDDLKQFLQTPAADNCCAIDCNSKFEIKLGLKNPVTVQQFIQTLNNNYEFKI